VRAIFKVYASLVIMTCFTHYVIMIMKLARRRAVRQQYLCLFIGSEPLVLWGSATSHRFL